MTHRTFSGRDTGDLVSGGRIEPLGGRRSRRRAPARAWRRSALAAVIALTGVAGLAGTTALVGAAGPAGAAVPTTGQLTGNVVVRNAPAGFSGEVGVVVCPATTATTAATASHALCPSPEYAFSGSGGSYTLALAAGTWQVYTFYDVGFQGGAYVGRARTVVVAPGATVRLNIAVPYQVPSTIAGTATVTSVPSGVSIDQVQVTACPSSTPLVDDSPSPLCATDYLAPGSDQYSIPTLYKGTWLVYVGYYTLFGLTVASTPRTLVVKKATSSTVDLSVAYQTPTNAIVQGSVTVTGAPAGFSAASGVGGCPEVDGSPTLCADPLYTLAGPGDSYELLLPAGGWDLAGFYELAFYGGQFLSPVRTVDLAGGTIVTLNFTVPYTKPATITSTITVTGVPAGQVIEETMLLACPSDFPDTGQTQPIECVSGFSAPGTPISIPTLPPGKWLLYPGYLTASDNEVTGSTATKVTLAAGRTKMKNLSIAYQAG